MKHLLSGLLGKKDEHGLTKKESGTSQSPLTPSSPSPLDQNTVNSGKLRKFSTVEGEKPVSTPKVSTVDLNKRKTLFGKTPPSHGRNRRFNF